MVGHSIFLLAQKFTVSYKKSVSNIKNLRLLKNMQSIC